MQSLGMPKSLIGLTLDVFPLIEPFSICSFTEQAIAKSSQLCSFSSTAALAGGTQFSWLLTPISKNASSVPKGSKPHFIEENRNTRSGLLPLNGPWIFSDCLI